MLKILRQPYPFYEKVLARVFLQCVGEGVFIALFLILFQPFGILGWHDPNKKIYLAGYGLVTTICGLILRFGIFKTFAKYHNEAFWNIGKEIVSIMTLIFLITIGNCFYSILLFDISQNLQSFLGMLLGVMVIGVFPATFSVMLNYIYQLKKYNQTIVVHHPQIVENRAISKNKELKLIAENEKNSISISSENLFYIESSDNYSTVFYEKSGTPPGGKLQKELLRSSLTRLESQISSENIVRCHRSFIVNLDKVERVTGNAQGYKLHFQTVEFFVPVARKYSEIIERLK
jgi:LytTr DNA-binding domain